MLRKQLNDKRKQSTPHLAYIFQADRMRCGRMRRNGARDHYEQRVHKY